MDKRLSPNLSWREGANYASPIQKVLAFDYYDGPTYGVLQCGDGSTYRFDLLAWDQEILDLRVFGLWRFPRQRWEQLIAAISARQIPRWPVWVLGWDEGSSVSFDDIRRQAGPVEWVVGMEDFPAGQMLRVKSIYPEELNQVTDWGTFLGLAQELPARGPY
jgi:hypothetical protein